VSRARTTALASLAWLGVLAAAAGCDDTLPKGYTIEKTRTIGARVEVGGDPSVASPRAGETAHVTWLVVDPAEPAALSWIFAACAPRAVRVGLPECAGGLLAPSAGTSRPPALDVTVPAAEVLGEATSLLVAGAICVDGTPSFDPVLVTLTVPITSATDVPNRQPTLQDDALRIGDTPWPAPADLDALPLEGCAEGAADPAVPRIVVSDGTKELHVVLAEDDREAITVMRGDPPTPFATRETLQLSHFATGGELDRQFSVVEAGDTGDALDVEVDWDPPAAEDVSPRGTLVRFHFVLRDLRGGTSWVSRAVCATAP
jgi:hypothetical protein